MNRALTVFLISVGCAPAEAEPVIEGAVDVVVIESDYTTGLVSGWSAGWSPIERRSQRRRCKNRRDDVWLCAA